MQKKSLKNRSTNIKCVFEFNWSKKHDEPIAQLEEQFTFNKFVGSSNLPGFKMSRSVWKRLNGGNNKISNYTFNRNNIIIPEWIGKTINIHQGKHFIQITINTKHVGKKLGEFSFTKYPAQYKTKKK